MGRITSLAFLACSLFSAVNCIPTITAKGAKLFTSDGKQFYNKGVAYQGTPDDPLVNVEQCTLDVSLMKTIGANSIRVYHVDAQLDHDGCMKVLADAGIYVWLDLDTFTTYILQDNPYWTSAQYSKYAEVMDTFIQYDNLAGFWIGNEIINTAAGSPAAPYIKAAVADMKAYRASKNYREVPIGYSAADIAELRPMLQNYLACGDNRDAAIDFYGLNSYEWCGTNTFNGSGYNVLQEQAVDYGTPIFFSETGCNVGGPRTFEDQDSILGPDMEDTWSGTIIYEWVEEANNYGLISYAGGALSGTPTPISPDFTNLANQWKTLSPTGVLEAQYTPSLPPPACPSSTPGGWLVQGNPALPTLGVGAVSKIPITTGGVVAVVTSAAPSITTAKSSTFTSSTIAASSTSANAKTSSTSPIASPSPSSATSAASRFFHDRSSFLKYISGGVLSVVMVFGLLIL